MKTFQDKAFMQRWEEEMEQRMQQLTQKIELKKKIAHTTNPIDFMFMTLPGVTEDGSRVPRNEPLDHSLFEAL